LKDEKLGQGGLQVADQILHAGTQSLQKALFAVYPGFHI